MITPSLLKKLACGCGFSDTLKSHQFVDLFKVGKINYNPIEKTIDWARFGREAIGLLESLGKEYYIKEDLKKWL